MQVVDDTDEKEIIEKLFMLFEARSKAGNTVDGCRVPAELYREDASGYVNQTLSVYAALCLVKDSKFDDFIFLLDDLRTQNKGLLKRKKWKYGDDVEYIVGKRNSPWSVKVLERSLQRLYQLEKNHSGDAKNVFGAAWAMLPSSDTRNTSLDGKNKILAQLAPDYIGIDGFQSGLSVSWDWSIPTPELNCKVGSGKGVSGFNILNHYCQNYGVVAGFNGHFRRVENERGRFNTTSLFLGLNFSRPENFLRTSSGIRVLRSFDYFPYLDKSENQLF